MDVLDQAEQLGEPLTAEGPAGPGQWPGLYGCICFHTLVSGIPTAAALSNKLFSGL